MVQVNELERVAACGRGNPITVLDPNEGENWWTHETFTNMWWIEGLNCSGHLGIDLWYSADRGKTWVNVAKDEGDDGAYDWEIPILLGVTNDYYVPSELGRIKAVAKCDTYTTAGWDISDEDFTITLNENSLTGEERKLLIGMGLMTYHQEEVQDVENATSSIGESPPEPTTGCEPETLQLCNTGNLGVCGAGTQACNQEGFWSECVQDNTSTTEICDNQLDDDCDGAIDCDDEDCAESLACQPEPEPEPEPYCGDGNLDETEECDDGNTEDGDGCSALCGIEPQPECTLEETQPCDTGFLGICGAGTQICSEQGFWGECVQNTTSTAEICDNQLDDDCDGTIDCDDEDCAEDLACQPEPYCGDGVINGEEQCDEGENNGTECVPEYDSSCTYCSTSCETIELTGPYCGDSNLDETEECDDGNNIDGDGCSASCVIETPEP